jgi:hypothetical protein
MNPHAQILCDGTSVELKNIYGSQPDATGNRVDVNAISAEATQHMLVAPSMVHPPWVDA